MHGLVNRAIEGFTRATYGDGLWASAARAAGSDPRGFALMRNYDDALTGNLMRELARRLSRSPRELAEDIGAWTVSLPSIRRLLRFAGPDFHSFMLALPELHGRATMVLPGLDLPRIALSAAPEGWVVSVGQQRIWLHALCGMLHAMADDYGVLAVMDFREGQIHVSVPLVNYSAGRPFSISDPTVGA